MILKSSAGQLLEMLSTKFWHSPGGKACQVQH